MSYDQYERRVKVCFKCKEYILIWEDQNLYQSKFELQHVGHPVQISTLSDLDDSYKRVEP